MNLLTSSVVKAEESEDFAEIQAAHIRAFRAAPPGRRARRGSRRASSSSPTDSATGRAAGQVRRLRRRAHARAPRRRRGRRGCCSPATSSARPRRSPSSSTRTPASGRSTRSLRAAVQLRARRLRADPHRHRHHARPGARLVGGVDRADACGSPSSTTTSTWPPTYADWSRLPEPVEVVEFADHLADEDALVAPAAALRRRRRHARADAVPARAARAAADLRLLVTTGGRNAAIDVAAAAERGITVCGTGAHADRHGRAHLGADPRRRPAPAAGGRLGPRRRLAADDRRRPRRRHARRGRARPPRAAGRPDRAGLRAWTSSPGARTSPPSAPPRSASAGSSGTSCSRTADVVTIHLQLLRPHPRADRRPRARPHEADRDPGQHLARPDRRRGRPGRTRCGRARSPAPASTSSTPSRCRADHPLRDAAAQCSRRTSATSPSGPTRSSTATPSRTSPPGSPATRCGCSSPEPDAGAPAAEAAGAPGCRRAQARRRAELNGMYCIGVTLTTSPVVGACTTCRCRCRCRRGSGRV